MLHHRMRRAVAGAGGEFTPADIATIRHFWNGSDLSTLWEEPARTTQATQDSVVGAWDDTITGTPVTEATIRPLCKIDVGGVLFSSDILRADKSLVSWMTDAGRNYSIFVISNPSSLTNNTMFASAYTAFGFGLRFLANKVEHAVGDGSTNAKGTSTASATVSTIQLSEGQFDNDNNLVIPRINNVYSGGQAAWANDMANNVADDRVSIGGLANSSFVASLFAGHIYDIVVCEEITAGERANLMAYWNNKFGLSLS